MTTSTFTVERTITVAAPPATVYALLEDFRRWPAWSPWENLDPQMTRTYSGAERGTGAVYEWSGNRKAGQGRMQIVEAAPGDHVRIALAFDRPMSSNNDTRFTLQPDGDGTRVTWTMTGPRPLIMRVLGFVLSMDKLVGKDFEKGLAQLKAAAEAPGTGPG